MKNEDRAKCINNAKNYVASVKKSLEQMENNLNSDNETDQDQGGCQATALKICLDDYLKHFKNIIITSIDNGKVGNFYDK